MHELSSILDMNRYRYILFNFWNSSHLPIQHILEVNLKFESDEKSKLYTATQVVLPIRCVLHVFFIIIFFMSKMCAIVTFIFLNFLSMT